MKMTWLKNLLVRFPHIKWLPLGLAAVIVVLGYQNCSKNEFLRAKSTLPPSPDDPTPTDTGPDAKLVINDGALYTNDEQVKLTITPTDATKMHLTNDACPTNPPDSSTFEPLATTKSWVLAGTEGKRSVNLIVENDKQERSKCITAHITLDQTGPTIKFMKTPPDPTASETAHFEIDAKDALSDIEGIYCRLDAAVDYTRCDSVFDLPNLTEGPHSLKAYAKDNADNSSTTIEHTWFVDLTPPKVYIVAPLPPQSSNGSLIAVHFTGEDPGGTGIDRYECFLNNAPQGKCTSPFTMKDLPDANYEFKVVAYDKVQRVSAPAKVTFTVDSSGAGDFQILGISGGKDIKVDAFLTDLVIPQLSWSKSAGAASYSAFIYDKTGKTLVCGPTNFAGTLLKGPMSPPCVLKDNTVYLARMTSIKNDIVSKTPDFPFMVDATPPLIVVKSIVTNDEKQKADIKFEITDQGSGVKTAMCYRTRGTSVVQNDCFNKTEISYAALVPDDYIFSITATDEAGNVGQSGPKPFEINEIVCDPFRQSTEDKCIKGLRANLYYASAADRAKGNGELGKMYDTVGKLIQGGIRSKSVIYFPFLDVRRREFTEGFTTNAGKKLLDDEGKVLYEWFAMRMTSVIKLGPTDPEGYYQFLLISDDGANLFLDPERDGKYATYLNNDQLHGLKVGCSAMGREINFKKDSRIPTMIHYYQGPRYRLGVSLFWRKVPKASSPLSKNCGFQSIDAAAWNGPSGMYNKILQEGFKPLNVENFLSEE